MNKNNPSEVTFINDREWSMIDGELCRVIDFIPLGFIKDGKISTFGLSAPYASVTIECKKYQNKIKGFITHKMDFLHLWAAFKERTIKENEEAIICWTKRNYKLKLLRFFPGFWPKLWVMICQKGAFELMTDPNYKPELKGEARFLAEKPIIDWKPEIME